MDKNYSTPRNIFFSIFLFLISLFSFGQTTVSLEVPGSSTWTVPCDVTSITVKVWGAGGAGRGNDGGTGGAGGGAGGYTTATLSVTSGQVITYTVGLHGVKGAAGAAGTDGGNSTFLGLTAYGGTAATAANGIGLGGSASGGTTNLSGGNGSAGSGAPSTAGGAGGSAQGGGGVGGGGRSNNDGYPGESPGGGGGGGDKSGGTNKTGGNGGNGKITITYTSASSTAITNNKLTYTNGTSGSVSATNTEYNYLSISIPGSSPTGTYFSRVSFASFGNPTTSPSYSVGSCHSGVSQSVTESYVLANTSASIYVDNNIYTDVCYATGKTLAVTAEYVEPLCYGGTATITGSSPSGGNGTFTYQWQSSTTGPSSGFSAASGTNNTQSYTSGPITQTTWFRRVVTSCSTTSTSEVVAIMTKSFNPGTIANTGQTICSGSVPTTTIGSTAAASSGTSPYTYQWQYSTDATFTTGVTTVSSNTTTYTPTQTLTQTTYYRRQAKDACGVFASSTNTWTVTVNTLPAITTQPSTPTATCSGSGTQTISVVATGAGLTYQWRKGGVNLSNGGVVSNATTATLTLTNPTTANAGSYDVVISGTCTPSVTSNAVTVTVNTAPAITTQPSTPTATCSGSGTQTMTVVATGTGLKYQWRKGGVNLSDGGVVSGATTATLTLTSPTTADAGSYDVVISGTCTPSVTSSSITVTVNPILAASVSIGASPSSTICSGTSVTFTATPTNGGASPSYQWKVNGSNVGTNSSTYTSNTLANGDAVTVVMTSNASPCLTGSPATSNTVSMVVNSIPGAPALNSTTQPTCVVSTGSVVLSGLPSSGTIFWTGTASSSTAITGGGTQTISGLAAGTYNFTVTNGSGCTSSALSSVTITSAITKTWDGSSWSPAGTPTINDAVIFNGNYTSSGDVGDLDACSCTVNSGAAVVFNSSGATSGHTFTVANSVTVSGTGTLTFENNASLVQTNDAAVNSGSINYKRNTTPILKTDYTYWSSPVSSFTLGGIASGTLYYSFNASIDNWAKAYSTTVMETAKGYIVRGPSTYSTSTPAILPVTFVGTPNNGNVTIHVEGDDTSNLIGNPYPSAIDADAFLTANIGVLEGTLYFWTHNTAIQFQGSTGHYVYTSDDYASYNLTGMVVTSDAAISGGTSHDGNIAAGQGFMATGYGTGGNVVYNNSMRISGGASGTDNAQFFKQTSNSKKSAVTEKNRVWLNLTNDQGAFKQLLVGYITGATNDYDRMYDGKINNANKYINFYSINNDEDLAIQGRALPFDKTDLVPLGYESLIAGDFTISIGKKDGLFTSQEVFVEDKLLNVIHDLKESAYTFTTETGTFDNRFVLRYEDPNKIAVIDTVEATDPNNNTDVTNEVDTTTETTDNSNNTDEGIVDNVVAGDVSVVNITDSPLEVNGVLIWSVYDEINIYSSQKEISDVYVYDSYGKLIYKGLSVDNNETKIKNLVIAADAVLIVKVELENGETVIKKVIR